MGPPPPGGGSPGYRREGSVPDEREDKVMRRLYRFVAEFLRREDGPTAVEYAVMLSLIVVVCVSSIQNLGANANKTFTKVATTIAGS